MLALKATGRTMSYAFFLRRADSANVTNTFKKIQSVNRVQRYLATSASTPQDGTEGDLERNSYYDKYKDKLKQRLKEMEQRGETVELPSKPRPTSTPVQPSSEPGSSTSDGMSDVRGGSVAARMKPVAAEDKPQQDISKARRMSNFQIRSLNSIVHLDLLKSKSAEEIAEIWKARHLDKDCITAVIPVEKYAILSSRAEEFKSFLLPLPRDEGYETMFLEFAGHQFQMTSLLNYKSLGESAPAQVTISHYTELQASHGIVLMRGEFDTKSLNVLEIQCLANQLQMYYLADEHSKHYKALEMFTRSPDSFQYSMLIDLLKESGMELMQRQQVLQKEEETTDTSTEPPPTN